MPLTDDVIKIICTAGEFEPTAVTASKISRACLQHFTVKLDLELESLSNTAVAIDFGGNLKELDRYRKAIAKTRDRMKVWAHKQGEML